MILFLFHILFLKGVQSSLPNTTVAASVASASSGRSIPAPETIPGIQRKCIPCEKAWNVAFVPWEFDPANAFKCAGCGNWSTSMKLFRDHTEAPSLDLVPDPTPTVSDSPFSDLPVE